MGDDEIEFCMIPIQQPGCDKFIIYPKPTEYCHCRQGDKKHFSMYGKFNEDRTSMVPNNSEDVKAFERYCNEYIDEGSKIKKKQDNVDAP